MVMRSARRIGGERSGERCAVGVDQDSRVANLLGCYRLEVLSFAEQDVERTVRCEIHPRFSIEETAAPRHSEAGTCQVRDTIGSAIGSAMAEVDQPLCSEPSARRERQRGVLERFDG